ncbi:MFS transporter [Kitasatospora phosalacinea]|uniref:MFS transporter n=1 Tax=Kitasatospora phosalacinea TaxID=2065 RepID=A0A9W6QD96_9ACTN|nr:MFS transporter [Kitasatospora phosalacinea]GLW73331.1 MFS transporter [Kitasatospora phosalacinea]
MSQARTGPVVGVLAGAGIVVSLMQTLVVPLIPDLPNLLHTSAANASWAITATLLAGAVATPVLGRLGDMYGKRRILLASLTMLVIGSLICGFSSSLAPLVVGRALQGVSAGVIPLGISIMRDELPPQKLGSSMALMSSSLGIGGAFGLPLSAVIAQHASWHALFWISAALGAVVAACVLFLVPESPVRSGGRFDTVGALGLTAGLVALLLTISKGSDWGWGSGTTLGTLAAAVVILPVWGWWELRAQQPLVDLRTSARRQVLMTNLASVVIGFAMYAMSLVSPQLLQMPTATGYGLGQSMVAAGLWMAPAGVVMMLLSPLSAKLSRAKGPKVSLLVGAVVITCGYLSALVLMGHAWGVLLFSCLISGGIAFAYAAMPALIMGAVPVSETAAANGLNTLMRSIGTSSSSAVIGVVLAHLTTDFHGHVLPSESGFRTAFVIGAGAAVAAALVTLAIPGVRRAVAGGGGGVAGQAGPQDGAAQAAAAGGATAK